MSKRIILLLASFLGVVNSASAKNLENIKSMSFFIGIGPDYLLKGDTGKLQTMSTYKSSKNSMAIHPVFGFDYFVNQNFSLGIETGFVDSTLNSSYKGNIATDNYRAEKRYFEIPFLIRARYIGNYNFNPFLKLGLSVVKTKEDYEHSYGGQIRDTKNINNKSVSPKIAVGCEYEIRDWMVAFVQYSYIHGTKEISKIQSIGIGIELKFSI